MSVRILLTHSPDARANYYGEKALSGLCALGNVVLHSSDKPLEGDALIQAAGDCALIVSYRQSPGPAEVFERLPGLVAFVRCAVDVRNIDLEAASKAGVLVTQASAGFVSAVTEMVVGFMIDLSRGITAHATSYRAMKVPQAAMGRQLRGSTLGVIGYGAIGRELVEVARALGMKVLVNDPYVAELPQTSIEDLLSNSDYVVPLAVATAETENLIGEREFSQMKRGSFFINVSRGNLVDEGALARALDSGRIAGCALDVGRDPDQMPRLALATRSDVIATPHTAGLTLQAIEHQAMETVAQAGEILKGTAPKGALNPKDWSRKTLLNG